MHQYGLYFFVLSYCAGVVTLVISPSLAVTSISFACTSITATLIAHAIRCKIVQSMMLASIGLAIAILRMVFVSETVPNSFEHFFDQKRDISGVVVMLPDLRETSERITIETQEVNERMRFIASVPTYPYVHVGDEVVVSGTLKKPAPFETDGGRTFQYDEFLRKDGVFGVMQPAQVRITGVSGSLWLRFLRMLETIKIALSALLNAALPEPESSLAAGLLVGGKQGLGKELLDAFTTAGMLQIIVLSGYNVMIVANTLMRALSALPKNISFSIGIGSILCFVLIAGAGSSALRAGLMAFLAISARTFGKRYDVMRAVWVSIFLLGFWNPLMLVYDPGFQFSFIATLGLILGVPVLAPKLLFLKSTTLIELVSTTLAAEMALLPFLLWQTGNLSLVSVFANVIAMPAVPLAMGASVVAGLLAFPLGLVSPALPALGGVPAYLPLTYIINVATLSASLPFAHVILPAFPFWLMILSYLLLGFFWRRSLTPPHLYTAPQPLPS